jgi:capsular exopolysaccharide synthesis family protein
MMQTASETGTSVLREAHLRDYWKIVWQGRWTILAVFVAVVGATAAWTFLQTPIYNATAIVEVQPQARRLLSSSDASGLGAAGYGWFAEEKYHNTQIEIIKSRDVSKRVVATLGLDTHPRFAEHPDVVEAFRSLIRVAPRRDTGLLEISISGADRYEATQWANAVAEAYVARNFETAKQNSENALRAIQGQMKLLSGELTVAEDDRIEELEESQLFDTENQEALLRQQHQTLTGDLTEVNIELSQLSETLRQIERMRSAGQDLMVLPDLASDTTLQELQRDRVGLQRRLESAKVELRSGHPEYEQTMNELESVEERIDEKTRTIVASLMARYQHLQAQAEYLRGEIQKTEKLSLELAKSTSRYDIVKTDAETKKQIFDLIARTVNEVQLGAELMNNNVSILDEAHVPLFPIKPRKRVNLLIGAFLGMFCGLAAVFFLDYLDNTIRTPEDVEKYLGATVLGVIPKMHDADVNQRAVKEAYQSLRTSVIFSSKNRERKIILITSSGPREGKSSTISNLGRTLAAAGDRVVIIDCDLRRPRQHEHFDVAREPGITNYLAAPAHETDWTVYLRDVEPTGLQLLTCGPIPPSPPELLSNPRFTRLLAAMRESYEWVLIDSPPAATLSDAALLASAADMVIPVIQHNSTDRDHVVKTISQLRGVNPEIPGVVLNNVDLDRAYRKDYYYAGYYYEEEDAALRGRKRRAERKKAQVG